MWRFNALPVYVRYLRCKANHSNSNDKSNLLNIKVDYVSLKIDL
ncbi:hypothetical protein SAMN05660226_02557 [Parapedobacter luteus]|uniref:Uncharacterized protein n=1 Tax=Parapedobacter luteus TaxID=623280 RepID=A0A1T5D213_9SPHI|nr:hypothetical protein SAMN05660226_02557 [Parapedobacter luteus]